MEHKIDLTELTLSLASLMSVTGHTRYSKDKLLEIVSPYFDEVRETRLGCYHLIRRCGKENAKRILVDAHFDEIGMIVTEIKENGFLTVTSIGGLDTRILQASEVIIYGEGREIYGFVGSTPPHLQKPGESGKLRDITDLLIDTGYSKEELEKYVSIGTPIGFRPVYTRLRNNKIAGKGFDDKACAACAIAAVAEIPSDELWGDVYVQLSNYEEAGGFRSGAQTGAYEVNPVCAIVADVDLGTTPDTKRSETVPLDGGPSISTGPITDKRLTALLRKLADEKEIKHQMSITAGGTGTNTMVVNLVRNGIPTVDIGLPLRSMHTSNEVISMNDAAAMRDLIALFVTSPEIEKEVCPNE